MASVRLQRSLNFKKRPILITYQAPWRSSLIYSLLFFLFYSPISASLDLKISSYFYQNKAFTSSCFLEGIYHYGILPGWILMVYALFGLMLTYFNTKLKKYVYKYLVIILTLAIGSGLFVHLVLKENWGRPRPKQTIEFGGTKPFRPFYYPDFSHQPAAKSFACGHCTMGFCFFALFFIGQQSRDQKMAKAGLALAFLLGGTLGYARIAQGGHFLSDVIVSAFVMWWTALLLAFYLQKLSKKNRI